MFIAKMNKNSKQTINASKRFLLQILSKVLSNTVVKKGFTEVCSKVESVRHLNKQQISNNVGISLEKSDSGLSNKSNVLFFDFQSTTPIDPRVLDAMLPYMTYQYGNPHSKSHEYGWTAEKAVETARKVR